MRLTDRLQAFRMEGDFEGIIFDNF